ncbi:hypothetical protein N8220_00380 [Schleiferiaceae bacterium]|nr:hypothetical protein [Schleiferiaceae bacterium]
MHAFWLLLAMQVLVVVVFTMLKIKKLNLGDSAPKIKVLKIWFLFVLIKLATGLTSIVLFQVLDGYLSVMMMLIALSPYLFDSSTKIKLIVYVTSVLLEVYLGNKGGLYTVAMMVLFEIYIRNLKISIYKMTLSVGIISFLGLTTFFIGADIRHGNSLLEGLENIPTIFEHSDYYLSALFERVGYLDVLARFVFDHRDYSDIFNLKYYFISVVDNLPVGVNLNNNLRVSTAIHFIPQPNSTNYFSEIITLPAEMLMVFGAVFLAPLMLILLISRVVLMLSPKYMMISLGLVFDRFLFLSFGLDWMLELLFLFLFFAFLLRLRLC